uniref:Prefoldin subunit 2 n=1 Tax=Coccolithus braarudii TaxID=221442 RepID=A0A7S0LDD9_9EUKA|mmetsp:Transcript_34290/g.73225  ORF Transcript_34290/g.73225 Transcript_34290/m.73225 type:complete len:140 (+) Transcript_34290:110-529(+)
MAVEEEEIDAGEAQSRLEQMRSTCEALLRKINQLELDANEHKLVCEAIRPLDPGRKCFRMIGGVIVERTVAEVVPSVQQNMEQITGTMEKLTEQLKTQQQVADEYAAKHRLNGPRGGSGGGAAPKADEVEEGGAQGVLI